MYYAKLVNGFPIYAPKGIEINRTWYIPPTIEWLTNNGYKEVVLTPMPTFNSNSYFEEYWKETETQVIQAWKEVPLNS